MSLMFAGVLNAASGDLADPPDLADLADPADPAQGCKKADTSLSSFDYLVLASLADAQRPFALATFQPQPTTPPSLEPRSADQK
jgi:hypothetical protein